MSAPAPAERPVRPGRWHGVELLERAIGYTRGSLALVVPELLAAPTPCAGWDLRRLLAHMDDSLASLHEAGSVRRVSLALLGTAPEDPAEELRRRACQLLADWAGQPCPGTDILVAGRPLTASVLAAAGALEVAVHGWDVAVACGAPRPLPQALAADLLRVAPVLVTEADRPGRFGAPVEPPVEPVGDTSASAWLLGYLGRSPDGTPPSLGRSSAPPENAAR
jgi:uncharacterized protein (TIGR03086 family)